MAHAGGLCVFPTAIGKCAIAWAGDVITAVQLPEPDDERTVARMQRHVPDAAPAEPPAWVQQTISRIQGLLEGTPDDLADVRLAMESVPEFNRQVYEVTRAIPHGRTLTYGEVARKIGDPGAARAVGQALGHNPFAPVVPCHRVLAAHRGSGGFSADGGVATKLKMLEIEKAQLGDGPGLFD
jgi:methylated-DNA-[protein]-cysteine S-methyltransferase